MNNSPYSGTDPTGEVVVVALLPVIAGLTSGISLLGAALVAYFSRVEAEFAAVGLPGPHNGPGDAVRHCVWMARTASIVGAELALIIGNARELADVRQPHDEYVMDTRNNRVGASMGDGASSSSDFRSLCIGQIGRSLVTLPRHRW